MKRIFLYGLEGAENQYRVVKYNYLVEDDISIRNIWYYATWMQIRYPSIKYVYAVDDRKGLLFDYKDAIRGNSIESFAVFKDMLEKEGIKII